MSSIVNQISSPETRRKRIYRDFEELQYLPVYRSNCAITEEDYGIWHGNIQGSPNSVYEGIVVHFIMTFPKQYPSAPIKVTLCSFVDHVNVISTQTHQNEVCLDMLAIQPSSNSVADPYRYWSSCYTARSVVMQLVSFLLCDEDYSPSQASRVRMRREAENFTCICCGHSMSQPEPPITTEEAAANCPHSFPPINITGREIVEIQTRRSARNKAMVAMKVHNNKLTQEPLHKVNVNNVAISRASPLLQQVLPLVVDSFCEDWTTVSRGSKYCMPRQTNTNPTAAVNPSNNNAGALSTNSFAVLETVKKPSEHIPHTIAISVKTSKLNNKPVIASTIRDIMKKHQASAIRSSISSGSTTKCLAGAAAKSLTSITAEKSTVTVKMSTLQASNFTLNFKQYEESDKELTMADNFHSSLQSSWTTLSASFGSFSRLSNSAINVEIFSYLNTNEILSVSSTCRLSHALCDDPLLWKRLFTKKFPFSALHPQRLLKPISLITSGSTSEVSWNQQYNSWKHGYILENNCLADEPTCFYSKTTRTNESDVLGIPLVYTINPVTKQLDYITSSFDVISWTAFNVDRVIHTVSGEKFQSFLPLYLDENHFKRGLPYLRRTATVLIKDSSMCIAEKLVKLITSIMNTQAVLLCDKGIESTEIALRGYCQLHRLFIALVSTQPDVRNLVNKRLGQFMSDPKSRVKSVTPNLGELLPLISVSEHVCWNDISMHYLMESFDRSFLWTCTKDISLVKIAKGDKTRLSKYLKAGIISLRLTMFHSVFLNLLRNTVSNKAKPMSLLECADRYDIFLGRPSLDLQKRFQKVVLEILEVDNWPSFFTISNIPMPTPSQLLHVLESSAVNSKNKNYHSDSTRFENIHKSGVSKILLQGESYTAAPNLTKIKLYETWKYKEHTIFLDASCFIIDFTGQHLGFVDYGHVTWHGGTNPENRGYGNIRSISDYHVRHSGDVMDHSRHSGEHTIEININKMPNSVAQLVFTVSAWTTMLNEIEQPSVRLVDDTNGVEMCRYTLDDKVRREGANTHTAVIMCVLERSSPHAKWALRTVGQLCQGRASNYGQLIAAIAQYCPRQAIV